MTNATCRIVRSARLSDESDLRRPRYSARIDRRRRVVPPVEVGAGSVVAKGDRIILRHPHVGPPDGIDVTRPLIAAIAQELWKAGGGNEVLNWLEAEHLVNQMIANGAGG